MDLAQRIIQARKQRGLTQGDLAELTGIRQQMISKLERGIAKKTSHILILAHALSVDAEWLGGIKEDAAPYHHDEQSDLKTVLQFLQLHCLDKLETRSTKEQLRFIETCLTQLKKTKNKDKHRDVLLDCLNKI